MTTSTSTPSETKEEARLRKNREKSQRYRERNPEKVRASNRAAKNRSYAERKESIREYQQRPENRARQNELSFFRKYGITLVDRDQMLANQGGVCAICKTHEPPVRGWHTDHCHETGRVRGLLCQHCNLMLGHARDNPAVLAAAIQYLRA